MKLIINMAQIMVPVYLIFCLLSISVASVAYADSMHRPDMHAPIGVMGDHGHKKGEWMFSYRYMRMEMDGNRSGSRDQTTAEVRQNFLIAPIEMTMEMHMFGAMYGLGNNLTLMAMLPYIDKSMDLINRPGVKFRTRAQGLGDTKLMVMRKLYSKKSADMSSRLGIGLGLSLPTGDTNKRGTTPMGNIRLPYPMQLGSGTYDPMIGLTYASFYPQWSWGMQFRTTQRLGKNNEGYRLGDEYYATTWAAYKHSDSLSVALRVDGKSWNNISGQDKNIRQVNMMNMPLVPTADPNLRAGERADVGVSVNFIQQHGMFKDHRLAAEFSIPFYQHLDGPQLEVDYMYTLGWQALF